MLSKRVIPILQIKNGNLVKTRKFKDKFYLGDPLNSVRIFNEKEVDELVFLDISLDRFKKGPNFKLIEDIASEAFMPFSYGGGISNLKHIKEIISIGVEKVILNTTAIENPDFISDAADIIGSSSIVVSLDLLRGNNNKIYLTKFSGKKKTKIDPLKFASYIEKKGAGELIINCIDNDGIVQGYDLNIIQKITSKVKIPTIALGGAGKYDHFREAIKSGASAVAGGSIFVLQGKHKAVLITYPTQAVINELSHNIDLDD